MMILSENSNRTIEAVVSMAQQGIQADGFNLTADGTFKPVSSIILLQCFRVVIL